PGRGGVRRPRHDGARRPPCPTPRPSPPGSPAATRPEGAGYVEQRGQYAPWTPSGTGPAVTPDDMGRYLADQLKGDQLARSMQQTRVTADDRMPGMGYVLEHRLRKGRPVVWKDGDVPGYHSAMALLPEQGFGVYVAVNGDGTGAVGPWDVRRIVDLVLDSRLPAAPVPEVPVTPEAAGSAAHAGPYRSTRTSRSSLMKAATLFAVPTVEAEPDGTLTTTGLSPDPARPTQHWIPVGPGPLPGTGTARPGSPSPGTASWSPPNSPPRSTRSCPGTTARRWTSRCSGPVRRRWWPLPSASRSRRPSGGPGGVRPHRERPGSRCSPPGGAGR
ncbi:serine hydrolase, partial [Kitasatospora albolonga]|uniref:serine hydrolase n=1 Tax=Kitasatospora albolonga TaxID=68173 RepID=UPI0031F00759